jgi:hypothetical protein
MCCIEQNAQSLSRGFFDPHGADQQILESLKWEFNRIFTSPVLKMIGPVENMVPCPVSEPKGKETVEKRDGMNGSAAVKFWGHGSYLVFRIAVPS